MTTGSGGEQRDAAWVRLSLRAGFTLVELLVALALFSILLALAAALGARAREAHATTDRELERSQIVELARESLRLPVALAGYRGLGARPAELGGAPVELGLEHSPSGGDLLVLRYLDDKWVETPTVRSYSFEAGVDSRGSPNLYRREPGSNRQPAVQEVVALEVVALLGEDGAHPVATGVLPRVARALELELSFSWGETRRMVLPFNRPQTVTALNP